jgi:fused signal recognition particle receptor
MISFPGEAATVWSLQPTMIFWKKKKSSPEVAGAAGVDPAAVGPEADPTGSGAEPAGLLARLRSTLAKSRQVLQTDIRDLWKTEGRLVDADFLKELYAVLIRSDLGTVTAERIRDQIGQQFRGRKVERSELLEVIRSEILEKLRQHPSELKRADSGPTVILVVGVNGSGKTTSIAKLAHWFTQQGERVLLGAGDTFRAAAVEQLKVWSERIGCDIVLGAASSDPASVAFKAAAQAVEGDYDVLIMDTAGRLQTQSNLMQELSKIRRVLAKQLPEAPHEVLLVLDATAGQNAISQARGFSEAAGCTGIVLAKLDGSAKGGVVVPVLEQFGLPVKLIGTGERLDALAPFDPEAFTRALLDLDDAH